MSYFCSLGGTSFVIKEYLKECGYQMSYCGDPMAVSKNTAPAVSPVNSKPADLTCAIQKSLNRTTGATVSSPIDPVKSTGGVNYIVVADHTSTVNCYVAKKQGSETLKIFMPLNSQLLHSSNGSSYFARFLYSMIQTNSVMRDHQ
ncbi:MAG: hypothetical protein EOP34_03990 [Rickettsiales bacterium]|nr:MAG: hypothetical protein EOP34_03990 [Rickettsiales bacterium]